jgi:hypothetical protein
VTDVQGASNSAASGTTLGASLTGVTAGNLIVFGARWEGGATTADVSDGTTTFQARTQLTSGATVSAQQFYLLVANSGNKTYTLTLGASRNFVRVYVREISYSGTCVFDAAPTGDGSTGNNGVAKTSGDLTTTGTDEVVVGMLGDYTTPDITGQLIGGASPDVTMETDYSSMVLKFYTSTGTVAVTSNAQGPWAAGAMSFKATAAGSSSVSPSVSASVSPSVSPSSTPSSSASPSIAGILLIERPVFDYYD